MTNTVKTGAVSWGDPSLKTGGGSKQGGKDTWLRLKPGSNLVRVLTDPFQYFQHKYKFDGDKGYGIRIPCAKPKDCIVCNKGDKAKKRWYLGVIDRSTNTYKILDVSWSVLSDIKTYAEDVDWGDTSEYDFDIVVNPNGGPQDYYKAVAKPKRPLSANDLMIQEKDMDLDFLEKRCEPASSEMVEKIFKDKQAEFSTSGSDDDVSAPHNFADSDADFPDADKAELPF